MKAVYLRMHDGREEKPSESRLVLVAASNLMIPRSDPPIAFCSFLNG